MKSSFCFIEGESAVVDSPHSPKQLPSDSIRSLSAARFGRERRRMSHGTRRPSPGSWRGAPLLPNSAEEENSTPMIHIDRRQERKLSKVKCEFKLTHLPFAGILPDRETALPRENVQDGGGGGQPQVTGYILQHKSPGLHLVQK